MNKVEILIENKLNQCVCFLSFDADIRFMGLKVKQNFY